MVRTQHGTLAELSRIAALATARLDQAGAGRGTAGRDLAAVRAMLQEIETAGHQAYLAKLGSEEDYPSDRRQGREEVSHAQRPMARIGKRRVR